MEGWRGGGGGVEGWRGGGVEGWRGGGVGVEGLEALRSFSVRCVAARFGAVR